MKNRIKISMSANDVWLLFFFAVHAVYIALCVFFPLPDGDEKSVLDVVMRTAAAVLAGYFMSKKFRPPKADSAIVKKRVSVQSVIVGCTGAFSLCIIIVVRYTDFTILHENIIVQLRDFYLASIAFLMGTSK